MLEIQKMSFLRLVAALKALEMNWFPFTYILANLITNSIHAWLTKDYRSSCMYNVDLNPLMLVVYIDRFVLQVFNLSLINHHFVMQHKVHILTTLLGNVNRLNRGTI